MAFLNPLLLFALAAAALPLLIHLFHLRRPRVVTFSSLRFVRALEKEEMRRLRIRQWLLLLLRMLVIACLVLAFARPVLPSEWAGVFGERGPTARAIVVDNSVSMASRDEQGALLQQARELALELTRSSAEGDAVVLVPTGGGAAAARTFTETGPALDALAALDLAPHAGTTADAIRRAATLVAEAGPLGREVLVLSDLQRTTFADSLPIRFAENTAVTLLPLGAHEPSNAAVTDVEVLSRVVEAGQPVEVEATVVLHGGGEQPGYGAEVLLEGERVAQASVDLVPGVPQRVRFTLTPRRRGLLRGEVRLEPDGLEADDVRYFVLDVPEARRVLVVEGEGQRADLVEVALSVVEERGGVAVTAVPESRLPATPLADYDAVVLVGPGEVGSAVQAELARFVEGGGGVLLFPGDDASALNPLLGALGAGAFGAQVGAPGGAPVSRFEDVDLEHPVFERVVQGGRGQVESPEISAYVRYAPGRGNETTVVRLAGGAPFLQEVRTGEGRVLVLALPPSPAWSDVARRGLFVPLLYRSVLYLGAGPDAARALTLGRDATVRVGGASRAGFRVIGPEGREAAPEVREVPGGAVLRLEAALDAPGFYDIRDGERLVRRLAVNLDPREADLDRLSPDEAADWLAQSGAEVRVLDAAGARGLDVARTLEEAQTGVEVWWAFLAAALALLVLETILGAWMKPERASA